MAVRNCVGPGFLDRRGAISRASSTEDHLGRRLHKGASRARKDLVYTNLRSLPRRTLDRRGDRWRSGPDLKGVYFILKWSNPLSDLFIKIEDTMPKDDSGSVSPEETADIIAYFLQSNDAPAGESEIPPDREQVKGILITRKPN